MSHELLSRNFFALAFIPVLLICNGVGANRAYGQHSVSASGPQTTEDLETQRLARRNKQVTAKVHNTTEIPLNFPVAMYKNNVQSTNFCNSIKGPVVAQASLITSDEPADVFRWYRMQCQNSGWLVADYDSAKLPESARNHKMSIFHAKKDKQEMTVTCSQAGKTKSTIVSISWMKVAK